ncbi:MAG: transposase [Aestuariivita sp.]|nr:transposase [Aestuariivita sp.]
MKQIWCLPPKANADFVYAMEDVLSVYQRDFAADTVLVCMDETSKQQTKATRTPLAVRSGQPAIDDVEYERNGTANRFMVCAPLAGWRQVKVTDRRTRQDFAELLKDLVDDYFPNKKIVLVMDNLNTHKLSVLYDRYEPAEAARIARQIAVH